jgi:hypothetical protein
LWVFKSSISHEINKCRRAGPPAPEDILPAYGIPSEEKKNNRMVMENRGKDTPMNHFLDLYRGGKAAQDMVHE